MAAPCRPRKRVSVDCRVVWAVRGSRSGGIEVVGGEEGEVEEGCERVGEEDNCRCR